MAKITNKRYLQFMNEGLISTLTPDELEQAIRIINEKEGKYAKQARALITLLFYTGARPVEILGMKAENITKRSYYVDVQIFGSKRGLPRKIPLGTRLPYVKELWDYAQSMPLQALLFYHYRGHYIHTHTTKKGETKYYDETSYKLRYRFRSWFSFLEEPLTPYFLRHNRFSRLMENGCTAEDIRILKGGRTLACVTPYLHMSSKQLEKIGRKIN